MTAGSITPACTAEEATLSTAEIKARIDEIEQQLGSHQCDDALALRARTFEGGHRHVVHQCQVCGCQRGGPVGRSRAVAVLKGQDAPLFDEALAVAYSGRRRTLHDELRELERQLTAIEDPALAEIRSALAQENADRADAIALATANARAALDQAVEELQAVSWQHRMRTIVQHLQREHAGAFVDPEAPPVNRFHSEPELRTWLDAWLAEDFDLRREVPGEHLTEGRRVKIDYVLFPRDHLVRAGFKTGPIGLEVKHLPVDHGFSSKASRFVWQAVSYTDCAFELNGSLIRLPRVLLFSNVSFDGERALLKGIDDSAISNDQAKWRALLELANHANVGTLEIYGTRERRQGWRIAFATGVYFRRSGAEYSISDRNLFEKVRVGNF